MAKDFRYNTLKKARLCEEDLIEISKAVSEAEISTNGEIAIAITEASHNYTSIELLFAIMKGAIVTAILLFFAPYLERWFSTLFWGDVPSWFLMGFISFASFATFIISFLCANIPFFDRIIIPKNYQSFAVYKRAMRHFVESGVYDTKENSGILIFVSLLERQVRIVADRGICKKVTQERWDRVAEKLAKGFSPNTEISSKDALLNAVLECSSLLQKHFPPLKDNPNELSDAVQILQGGE